MDEYVFQKAQVDKDKEFIFCNRQLKDYKDTNNGVYTNGEITFSLDQLASPSEMPVWSEATIHIPLVVVVEVNGTGATLINDHENAFAISLKNGTHHLVNSFKLKQNGVEKLSLMDKSNIKINYELLSSLSYEDYMNFSDTMNFYKDSAESVRYNLVGTSPNGVGLCNNIIAQVQDFDISSGTPFNSNLGRRERMRKTSFLPTDPKISNLVNTDVITSQLKNYCTQSATKIVYFINAIIPLKCLHDFFDKMPLSKFAFYSLVVNLNAPCQTTITTAVNSLTVASYSSTTRYGVLPFQISPFGNGSGLNFTPSATVATNVTVKMGIATVNDVNNPTTVNSHKMPACYLYIPMVVMTPKYEAIYYNNPVKDFHFEDCYINDKLMNQAAGQTINMDIQTNILKPRKLVLIPYMSSIQTNPLYTNGLSPASSPFSSDPGTTSPYSAMSNFQVLVNNSPVYGSPINYNFENYLAEICSQNGTAGLITQTDFDSCYKFITVDLSRHYEEEDKIVKTITVKFKNESLYACDYIALIYYERSMSFDCEKGKEVL